MKIEWEEPVAPRGHESQRAKGLWSKLRNSISVLVPEPGSGPRRRSTSNSRSRQATTTSHSGPRSPQQHSSRSSVPQRPRVTIISNGGGQPHTPNHHQRQYSYVIESPAARSPSPRSPTSPRHSPSTPRHAGPPREASRSHSGPPAAHPRPTHQRAHTTTSNGVMYNGKMIVGNPADVDRYVSSQKNIEKWMRGVR